MKVRLFSKPAQVLGRHKILLLVGAISGLALLLVPIAYTFVSTRGERYDLSRQYAWDVPTHRVAIVFGAGIYPDGTPTPYLSNRIETAVQLYKMGRVQLILMSGDNSTTHHNEPIVMQHYAVKLGVPPSAIAVDYAGYDTYDTCYRAHYIFGLRDATLITQGYHLPRAITTCKRLGLDVTGVVALHPSRDFSVMYLVRELVSTDKMFVQLFLKTKPPVLGGPIII